MNISHSKNKKNQKLARNMTDTEHSSLKFFPFTPMRRFVKLLSVQFVQETKSQCVIPIIY